MLIHSFSKFSDQVSTFADSLNFWTCMVNIVNGTMSIGIVIIWCFTIVGSRSSWMKLRLVSCASLLASIFLVLAAVIFSTFFDQLVILEKDRGMYNVHNKFTSLFFSNCSIRGLILVSRYFLKLHSFER